MIASSIEMGAVTKIEMAEKPDRNIAGSFKEYGKRLFGFIRSRVKTEEDAEDLLQDVWFQFSSLSSIEELENVSAWLFRVARNKVTDYYRKKKTGSLEDLARDNEENGQSFREIFLPDDNDPHLARFRDLFWEELTQALDELPENQRNVFILNELEDMTLQEIADMTGENLKTIISRKGYAAKHLRRRLEHLYNEINNS